MAVHFERVLRTLALAAGVVLIVLMLFTVADVILRYVFNAPFRSVLEFTEFSMALIVFLAMPYTAWVGGHIAVDVFERWLNRPSLWFLPSFLAILGGVLFAVMGYRTIVETLATFDQVSNLLRWPHYPFRFTVAFGSILFAIVLFIDAFRSFHRPPARES